MSGRPCVWPCTFRKIESPPGNPSSPQMHIRPATRADLDQAAELWRLLQDEHEAMEPRLRRSVDAEMLWREDFVVWVRISGHGIFVAEVEGRIVGLLTAHPFYGAPVYEAVREVHVNELIVLPEFRGRGLGRRLLEEALAWARGRGIKSVRAGVLSHNVEAHRFWDSVGARPFYTTVTIEL